MTETLKATKRTIGQIVRNEYPTELDAELMEALDKWQDDKPIRCPESEIIVTVKKCRQCNACGKWDQ